MATLTQGNYQTDFLKWEVEKTFCREAVTILAGSGSARVLTVGMPLGKLTSGGKYVQLAPAATDGSQNVAGILFIDVTAPNGTDAPGVIIARGPAVIQDNGIVWPGGISGGQKTTALGQIAALNIVVREGV